MHFKMVKKETKIVLKINYKFKLKKAHHKMVLAVDLQINQKIWDNFKKM